jgi:peptidoglycan/LPS O-acetylase OafA/YrhL
MRSALHVAAMNSPGDLGFENFRYPNRSCSYCPSALDGLVLPFSLSLAVSAFTSVLKESPIGRPFLCGVFFRIYPPYVLAVLLFALVVPWTRIDFSFSGAVQLLSHLALIHNLDNRTFYGLSPAFWSIAVEVQLYLLYPILVALVSRFGWNRSLMYIAALEITLRGICSVISIYHGDGSFVARWRAFYVLV